MSQRFLAFEMPIQTSIVKTITPELINKFAFLKVFENTWVCINTWECMSVKKSKQNFILPSLLLNRQDK